MPSNTVQCEYIHYIIDTISIILNVTMTILNRLPYFSGIGASFTACYLRQISAGHTVHIVAEGARILHKW